jgi:WD40 repeat protein
MPRFTLSQLFMAVSLLAILLAFSTMQGYARVFSEVNSLSFSPDGSKLIVDHLSAVDAEVPHKGYVRNRVRSLKIVNVFTATSTVLKTERVDGVGVSFRRRGNADAIFHPVANQVVDREYSGTKILIHTLDSNNKTFIFPNTSRDPQLFSFSDTGKLFAVLYINSLAVWGTHKNEYTAVTPVEFDCSFFGNMIFLPDESKLIFASDAIAPFIQICDLERKTHRAIEMEPRTIISIAAIDNNSFLMTSSQGVQQYDLDGKLLQTFDNNGTRCNCDVSRKNKIGAWFAENGVVLYDFSKQQTIRVIEMNAGPLLALSPEGDLLATTAGDTVSLWDVKTGHLRWSISMAERSRTPWFLPVGGLMLWVWVAWRMQRKQPTAV